MFRLLIPIIILHQLLIVFINNILNPIHYASKNLFFLGLIGYRWDITYPLLFILDLLNLILVWLISKHTFKGKFTIIPPFIYAIIPWSSYLVSAGSFYIYLLFIILVIIYGFLEMKVEKGLGQAFFIGGIVLGAYSSVFFLIMIVVLSLLTISQLKSLKFLHRSFIISTLLMFPLLFLIYANQISFKNTVKEEIRAFEDPGLINNVNQFQGSAKEEGVGNLARLSENKYIFTSKYLFMKYLKSFIPTTYFTSSEKLLTFSFSPPIYFGFAIPFLFGLYYLTKSSTSIKIFLLSSVLVIPSMLSKQLIDLNRMIIFAPVVIFVISFGLKKISKIFLVITICLVIFQLLVTLSDIKLRERDRYQRYFQQSYDLGRQ